MAGPAKWGLGSFGAVSLQDARAKASECRRLRSEGIDPIEARKTARAQAAFEAASALTFKQAASTYIEAHKAGWHNPKHAAQWKATLATYAEPVIGGLSIQAVDTTVVLKVLEPIWRTKPETASRLRGRIEAVLDWAAARGYRKGENPARWRGHLDKLLPARSKVRTVRHHAALPYAEIGEFMPALRAQEGTAARAFEFAILTAARTGEVIGARWSEFNLAEKLWTIPTGRMKAGKDHRVPLSAPAMDIIKAMGDKTGKAAPAGSYVFPGTRRDSPLSNMAFLMVLRRMERTELTAHGFRSTFRDWAAERTSFPAEVAEMALAHAVGDKVEAAYRRGDLFERRRRMMVEWAKYCTATKPMPQGRVLQFHRRRLA